MGGRFEMRRGEVTPEAGEARPRELDRGIEPREIGQSTEHAVESQLVLTDVGLEAIGRKDAVDDLDPARDRERLGGKLFGQSPTPKDRRGRARERGR